MTTTRIYQKINEWDEYCPKCGVITFFKSEEQKKENWVGECVKCALLSGNWEIPRNLPKWRKDLILIKHGLGRKGKKIIEIKNHGSN